MEEEELQQLMSKDNGKEFIQELFEEEHAYNIMLQSLRSRTKPMMKQKGKALVEEHVEKLVKKKPMSKSKES